MTTTTGQAQVTAPEQIHATFAEAVNRRDLERLVGLFEDDAVVIAPAGEQGAGERRDGIDAIRAHLQRLLAMQPHMTIVASRGHRNGDLALLSSHWRSTVTTPEGGQAEIEGRGAELARRQPDGTWRLVIDNPGGAG